MPTKDRREDDQEETRKAREERQKRARAREEAFESNVNAYNALRASVIRIRREYADAKGIKVSEISEKRNNEIHFLEQAANRMGEVELASTRQARANQIKSSFNEVELSLARLVGALLIIRDGINHNYNQGIAGYLEMVPSLLRLGFSITPEGGGLGLAHGSELYQIVNTTLNNQARIRHIATTPQLRAKALGAACEFIGSLNQSGESERKSVSLSGGSVAATLASSFSDWFHESLGRKKQRASDAKLSAEEEARKALDEERKEEDALNSYGSQGRRE